MNYNEVEAKIKDILICRLNLPIKPEEINSDTQIFGPGEGSLELDSVDGLEIVVGLSNEFGVTISEEDGPVIFQNIGTITNFVLEKTKNEN
jgi:acyl carrier protein